MPMNTTYLNLLRDAGQAAITHIGLTSAAGVELAGGGYARQPVTWVDSADGVSRPSANLVFTTEAGDVVSAWQGYSALTAGTAYGVNDLAGADVTYSNPGTYTLLAASTSINHTAT